MNKLWRPINRRKPSKIKTKAEQYWEEFTQLALDKGYTTKVTNDLAFKNNKGKQFKLVSTQCGFLTVYDETINQTYQIYRKAE